MKTEIETALTKRAVGEAAFPALDVYRATLRNSLAVIDGTTAKSQAQLDAGYLRTLNQMKSDLTKAGKLDDAIAVDKEIKNVELRAQRPQSLLGPVRNLLQRHPAPQRAPSLWHLTSPLLRK